MPCSILIAHYSAPEPINVGSGDEVTIAQLARLVADIVGFRGEFVFDTSKPDGTPRKFLDTSRLNALGWKASTPLRAGIESVYAWYEAQAA